MKYFLRLLFKLESEIVENLCNVFHYLQVSLPTYPESFSQNMKRRLGINCKWTAGIGTLAKQSFKTGVQNVNGKQNKAG